MKADWKFWANAVVANARAATGAKENFMINGKWEVVDVMNGAENAGQESHRPFIPVFDPVKADSRLNVEVKPVAGA